VDKRVLAARPAAPGFARESGHLDRLLIKDLTLRARIGIYPHEHEPQRVRINAEVEILGDPRPIGDDIANVISYEDLLTRIKDMIAAGHINLVETLAARIADICLADPRAVRALIRVEKLDIEPGAAVGIEIERVR
jgi:7,8-dihydroneopterin aldolase/epimerase/oxygenase